MIWRTTGLSSLTLVLDKVLEEIILSTITWHMQDNQGIRPSQHGFMNDRSYLTKVLLLQQSDPLSWWRKGCACSLSRLQWSIWHYLPEHHCRKTSCFSEQLFTAWMGRLIDMAKMDGLLDPETWNKIQLATACYLCSPGLSFVLFLLNIFIDHLDLGIEGASVNLQKH